MEPSSESEILNGPRSADRIKVLHKHIFSGGETVRKIDQNSTSSSIYPFNPEEVNGIDPTSIVLPTKQSSTVTPEQLKQYENEGYFVVKGLISSSDIKKYTEHFRKICAGEVDKQDMLVMRDVVLAKQNKGKPIKGEEEVTKIQDWQNDETLMQYVKDVNVLKYVEGVIGDNTRSIHTMLINKPPDLGKGTSEHPMHQDLLYFPFRPANRIVAAWTALQEINEENGCLSVMPGTHKLGLFPHHIPNELGNKAYQGVHNDTIAMMLQKEGRKMIPLAMQPGDTVFFHPCLIHGSGPNWSKKFRKAISCHYASGLCRFSRIPDHNFGVIEELFESLKHKYSLKEKTITRDQMLEVYIALWKVKSRQITGAPQKEWEVDLSKVEDLFK